MAETSKIVQFFRHTICIPSSSSIAPIVVLSLKYKIFTNFLLHWPSGPLTLNSIFCWIWKKCTRRWIQQKILHYNKKSFRIFLNWTFGPLRMNFTFCWIKHKPTRRSRKAENSKWFCIRMIKRQVAQCCKMTVYYNIFWSIFFQCLIFHNKRGISLITNLFRKLSFFKAKA